MGAPKGNKYYLLAESHGRDKVFETPQDLWDAFLEYQNEINSNPIIKVDFRGKDSDRIEIPLQRPLTLRGLAEYLGMTYQGIKNYGDLESHKDFFDIYARIENKCYNSKFEGAAVGIFNPAIIARDLGLKESSEIDHSGNINTTITKINYIIPNDPATHMEATSSE
jgi:hypothetical protein